MSNSSTNIFDIYKENKKFVQVYRKYYSEHQNISDSDIEEKVNKGMYIYEQLNIKQNVLLYGKIQGGKTSTFFAALSVALENKIRICIISTSLDNTLLDQTFERVQCIFKNLTIVKTIIVEDSVHVDSIFQNYDCRDETRYIFCIRKESKRLKALIQKIKNHNLMSSTLLIDDEADLASQTNTKAGTSKFNEVLVSILEGKVKPLYLSVTATPFANLLQPNQALKPKKIISVPIGNNYFGIDNLSHGDSLLEFDSKTIENHFFLTKGIIYYITAKCIRELIMHQTLDKTNMLIFIRKNKDQEVIRDRTNKILREIKSGKHDITENEFKRKKLINNTLPSELNKAYKFYMKRYKSEIIDKDLLDKDSFKHYEELSELSLFQFYKNGFCEAVNDIEVKCINKNTKNEQTNLNKARIFIGNNKMSRGMTFFNPVFTMFSEPRKKWTMDTQLQFLRMLGYQEKIKAFWTVAASNGRIQKIREMNDSIGEVDRIIEHNIKYNNGDPEKLDWPILEIIGANWTNKVDEKRSNLGLVCHNNDMDRVIEYKNVIDEALDTVKFSEKIKVGKYTFTSEIIKPWIKSSHKILDKVLKCLDILEDEKVDSLKKTIIDYSTKTKNPIILTKLKKGENQNEFRVRNIVKKQKKWVIDQIFQGPGSSNGVYMGDRNWHKQENFPYKTSVIIQFHFITTRSGEKLIVPAIVNPAEITDSKSDWPKWEKSRRL